MNKTGLRDDASLAAFRSERWPRSNWNAWPPSSESARWRLEVTFQEVRAHLGVETQRQWSDLAIMRTTPALRGLFSLVTLWAHDLAADAPELPAAAAWYPKRYCTFRDAIAAVRRQIWHHRVSFMSRANRDSIKIPRQLWDRAANALAYAA